jgi:hypothetical protein
MNLQPSIAVLSLSDDHQTRSQAPYLFVFA